MTQPDLLPMFDPPRFKGGERVRFTDRRGIVRESSVFEMADPALYRDGSVHVWSPWLSINFTTVDGRALELIEELSHK